MLLRIVSPKPAASALSARGSVYAGLIGCRCAPWSSSAGGRPRRSRELTDGFIDSVKLAKRRSPIEPC